MNAKKVTYWISTTLVVVVMIISGVMAITHAAPMMKALAHLGYPPYFVNLLGVAKLSGVCVLLTPGLLKFKEWAYAGFGITILSAAYSHLLSGDGWMALDPLFFFVMLITSYLTRPTGFALRPAIPNEKSRGAER
jgi:hypothetical protein